MDYSKYTPLLETKVLIDKHIIEVDGDIWQISNLSKVSHKKTSISVDFPEPQFQETPPKKELNFAKALSVFILGILISVLFLTEWIYILSIIVALGIIIYSLVNSKKNAEQWSKKKELHEKRLEKWHEINKDPPVVHSLTLEPNSKTGPLFYSYKRPKIENIIDTIKLAMADQLDEEKAEFKIATIDMQDNTDTEFISVSIKENIEAEIGSVSDLQYMKSGIFYYIKNRFSKNTNVLILL